MNSDWTEETLGNILELKYGKSLTASKRIEGNVPVYSSAGLTGWHNTPLVSSKGIIIGRKGTVGKVYKSNIPFFTIDTAYYVEPNDELYDFDFMFYLLSSLGLDKLNEDSAVPGLNRNTAYQQKFKFPLLPTQKKIAHILSTLDDKIELNRKMNQTLEEMAQALFKSWFVDFDPVHAKANASSDADMEQIADELGISKEVLDLFPSEFEESELGMIPQGWVVKQLSDFGRVVTGKTPPKKVDNAYNIEGNPFITPTDIDDSLFVTTTNRCLSETGQESVKNSQIEANSICVTCIGSQMGKTTITPVSSFTNQQINSIVINDNTTRIYIFSNLRNRKEEIFRLGSSGSTMPILNKSSFEKLPVILPNYKTLQSFNMVVVNILNHVLDNDKQTIILQKTRDTLLPKLLSGELDVSEFNLSIE